MPIIIDSFKQHDPEWYQARLGNPGASNFGRILTATGKVSEQRKAYMYELAGEFVSGRSEDSFVSYRMQQGNEFENESRMVCAMNNEIEIRRVALVYKDEKKLFHVSPDGLIGDDGCFETKDAKFSVQIERLMSGKMVTAHIPQCQGTLFITEREWILFQSYCSGLPELCIKIYRDEKWIARLAEELERFCYDLAVTIRKLKEMR